MKNERAMQAALGRETAAATASGDYDSTATALRL